jgi:iron complex transport system ATP-binding protein
MKKTQGHIISTVDLKIGYTVKRKELVIAQGLNINLKGGNLVGLIGKNGIGKSTLLRTLCKVQAPLNGDVIIDGKRLNEIDDLSMAKLLSLVLTEKLPENNLSVFELIALGRQPHTNWIGNLTSYDMDVIGSAIKRTHTEHLKDRKYYELSDGQLQKVLIARALAQDTDIIVLDEPTAHLDIHHTIETFTLLKKLAHEYGKTVIVSTHEINLILQLADQLWVMTPNGFNTGTTEKLLKQDSLSQLFDSELITFNKSLKQFTLK